MINYLLFKILLQQISYKLKPAIDCKCCHSLSNGYRQPLDNTKEIQTYACGLATPWLLETKKSRRAHLEQSVGSHSPPRFISRHKKN